MKLGATVDDLARSHHCFPTFAEGVAAVGLLFATVRRWAGPAAGLIAGTVFALTPVAVLMFRFNNPDALLVLLLVAISVRAVRRSIAALRRRTLKTLECVACGREACSLPGRDRQAVDAVPQSDL